MQAEEQQLEGACMTLMAPSGDVVVNLQVALCVCVRACGSDLPAQCTLYHLPKQVCFAPNIPNMIQYPMVYVQTGMTGRSKISVTFVLCSSLIGPMVSWAPSCDGNAATNATVATSANTNMSGMVDAATAWWPHQAMQNGQNLQVQQMQTQAQQATLQPQPQPPVQQAMLQQVMAQAQVQPQQNQMQQVQMHQSQMQQAQVHIQQVQLQAQMQQAAQMQSQMQQMPMQQLPLQPVQQNQLPDQMDKKIFHHPPSQFQVVRVSDDSQPKPLFNAPVRLTPAQGPTSDETGNVQDQTDAQQQPKLEPQAATAQKHQQHQPQRQQKQQAVAAQHDNRPHAAPSALLQDQVSLRSYIHWPMLVPRRTLAST